MQQYALPAESSFDCVRALPLGGLLLQLADELRTGTLLIHDTESDLLAALYLEAGRVVRGRTKVVGDALLHCLAPLCGRTGDRFSFTEDQDLLGAEGGVLTEAIDTLQLLTQAVRGPVRDDVIDEAIADLGQDLLKVSPRAELERYRFTANERRIVARLEEPIGVAELRQSIRLPERVLRRVLYLLLVTRAVTRLPPWRRMVSGAVMHAPALVNASSRVRNDEPTRVAPLTDGPGRTAPSRTITSWPPVVARGEVDEATIGRYHLRHPQHTDTVQLASLNSQPPFVATDASAHFAAAELLLARGNVREAVFAAQQGMKLRAPRPAEQALYAWLLYQRAGGGAQVNPHVWRHLESALLADPNCVRAQHVKALITARLAGLTMTRL